MNDVTATAYTQEPVRYPNLQVIDLAAEARAVTESYRNQVMNRINGSCLRLAVFEGPYRWHKHPRSDELFIVLEGAMLIELQGGNSIRLEPLQALTVPAGTVHRTSGIGRTVNLCFEELAAETEFLD
ncbi:MAG TPA: cupin domain-containing protein [Gammaproteobacteria bacterium]|nr:cupin domain-containing protein [Gammaproteobacteria bacterium]